MLLKPRPFPGHRFLVTYPLLRKGWDRRDHLSRRAPPQTRAGRQKCEEQTQPGGLFCQMLCQKCTSFLSPCMQILLKPVKNVLHMFTLTKHKLLDRINKLERTRNVIGLGSRCQHSFLMGNASVTYVTKINYMAIPEVIHICDMIIKPRMTKDINTKDRWQK